TFHAGARLVASGTTAAHSTAPARMQCLSAADFRLRRLTPNNAATRTTETLTALSSRNVTSVPLFAPFPPVRQSAPILPGKPFPLPIPAGRQRLFESILQRRYPRDVSAPIALPHAAAQSARIRIAVPVPRGAHVPCPRARATAPAPSNSWVRR